MSIPKEPRQLMINVMYLVLTALLALNVSAEIFNAFDMVNKGLMKANDALDAANKDLPQSIKDSAKKSANLAKYAERVDVVGQISKEGSEYIQTVIDAVVMKRETVIKSMMRVIILKPMVSRNSKEREIMMPQPVFL